jgi:hypothetical protein
MKEVLLALNEEKQNVQRKLARLSLMTPLGLVGGDILTYLENHGDTPLRRLTRELDWPSWMVMMGVGSLIREGLAQASRHDLEVVVSLAPETDKNSLERFGIHVEF